MILPTELDKVYAAGFFDGEGYVAVAKTRAKTMVTGYAHSIRVTVGQKNQDPLYWLRERWGGTIYYYPQHKSAAEWMIFSEVARRFLTDIQPFLIVKKAQVNYILGATKPLGQSDMEHMVLLKKVI